MSDLYLIAHKVRGEPAFDVARRMACPICQGVGVNLCDTCNNEGYWWIIPTSGHRAYPYWSHPLKELFLDTSFADEVSMAPFDCFCPKELPPDTPDHYACNDRPARSSITKGLVDVRESLSKLLGLHKAPPDFKRRI